MTIETDLTTLSAEALDAQIEALTAEKARREAGNWQPAIDAYFRAAHGENSTCYIQENVKRGLIAAAPLIPTPSRLRTAALALYMAGRWSLDNPSAVLCDGAAQGALWAELRDALGLEPGHATEAGVHEPKPLIPTPEIDAAPMLAAMERAAEKLTPFSKVEIFLGADDEDVGIICIATIRAAVAALTDLTDAIKAAKGEP